MRNIFVRVYFHSFRIVLYIRVQLLVNFLDTLLDTYFGKLVFGSGSTKIVQSGTGFKSFVFNRSLRKMFYKPRFFKGGDA